MTERDTLQYLRNYGRKVEENESKLVKLEESVKWDPKMGLQLKGPVYYSSHLLPAENGKINIGSPNHFVNNIYLAGKIIYPDVLDFGVNHDFCIDKMGRIGFHSNDHLDGVTIKGLPSFTIQNVPYLGDDILYFEMERGSIGDFVNCQDILAIDGIYFQAVEIIRDKIRIESLHGLTTNLEMNKNYDVIIYNTILGLKTAKNEDILRVNAFGDVFYNTMERKANINLNSEVYVKKLIVDEIAMNGKGTAVVPNLNAEFLCGKRAPQEGELVSTKDRQELWNKNFGNDVGMTFHRIQDLADPIHDMDGANKRYVDRYLSGLKVAKSVSCIAIEAIDADYDKLTGNLHFRMSEPLKSNTIIHIFDDFKVQLNDRVLLINQASRWQNGVYQVVSDGLETKQIILQRVADFCEKKSALELRGYYVFVRNGRKFGNTGFVFEYSEDFTWGESSVNFHIFSKMENCGATQGIKRVGNHFSLSIDDRVLKIEDDKLSIQPGKISNHLLENRGIHILPEGGIDIENQAIQLGDHVKLGLRVNKKQFKFGKNGELQLANRGGGGSDGSDGNLLSGTIIECQAETFAGVFQIYPPKRFEVVIQYSDDFFEKEKNMMVQYYICGINADGKESHYRASDEYAICDDAKSIFANLEWGLEAAAHGYVVYRRIGAAYAKVRMTHLEASLLDVIIPKNFSKIDWQPTSEPPPTENRTKVVVNRLGLQGDNFVTSGRLGIGTVAPKAGLHVKMNDIIDGSGAPGLSIEGNDKTTEMLRMIGKGIKNTRILGENGEGRSMLEMGKNIKLTTLDEEGVIYLGRDENAEDKNINRRVGSDDFVVQVQDGSIYSAGEIMAGDGKPFSSYNNKLGNNAAILKTGCVGNSIGNQVAFSWEGDQLQAVPFNDGNMLTRKKVQVKNFTIQHPVYPGKYLVHACLEGETADVYYRGKAQIVKTREFVNIKLPDYYCHIVESGSSTIQLTPIGRPFAPIGGEILERENIIRVWTDTWYNTNIPFYWEIKGKRKGTDFKVEPDKDEVEVKQWGPYTYMDGE
jgi:hypothetical protein